MHRVWPSLASASRLLDDSRAVLLGGNHACAPHQPGVDGGRLGSADGSWPAEGMYGPLIVDPPAGEGYYRHGAEVRAYDQEVLWIPDDVDPAWHRLDHSDGLNCPWDTSQHLLRFEPKYFLLSGVPHPSSLTSRRVRVRAGVGERLLVRVLNAAYGPVSLTLPFDATVVGKDGHALGSREVARYSRPYTIPAGAPINLTTAQRWDLLTIPDRTGQFTVPFDVVDWVRGVPHGRVETTITVT